MKNKSILSLFVFLLSFGVTTTSCEDMLTPEMDRYVDNFSGKDSVNFYLGILAGIQDMAENHIILGEIRGDLAEPTSYASDSITQIANFEALENGENGLLNRAAYYKVINQCNFYLAKVDTMVQKNNIFYMRKEFAQVQMMRAWTYMQLVQNYGEVPFITQPVDNSGTGWEKNSPEGTVTADNLLDKLLEHDLMRAYEYQRVYGKPNYGTFSTGAVDISHQLTLFPAELVLADLYLLRGKNTADYEQAATYYYEFLEEYKSQVSSSAAASKSKTVVSGKDHYTPVGTNWAKTLIDNYSTGGEMITLVPSAANSSIGKTLTRVPQIFGFDPHSTTSSSGGDAGISVSGRISVTPNYKNRQVGPTNAYINLCKAQLYVDKDDKAAVEGMPKYLEDLGDCRIDGTIKYLKTQGGRMAFVQKFASREGNNESYEGGFSFRYTLPIYRLRQVYLRYAEAINRAGYPRHAFAVLRNGLASEKMPAIRQDSIIYNDVDSTFKRVPYLSLIGGEGCDYIGVDEMRRAKDKMYLDFSDTKWTNSGIHSLGCGTSTEYDTLYTYEKVVAQRMLDEATRSGADAAAVKKYAKKLAQGQENDSTAQDSVIDRSNYVELPMDEPVVPADLAHQINAVESLIADEMALETAYEGWRYYDLMRLARHKNNDNYGVFSADFGTQWMAWKIARRSLNLKPYESPNTVDGALYGKLLNQNNWFLQNPIYE